MLLVDDQPLIRQGLQRVIDTVDHIEVAAECGDGDEVIDALHGHIVDLVVMDIRMKRMNGATATAAVRAVDGPPVLVLTTFDDDTIAAALYAGAAGFILKDARGEDLLRAIERVAGGDAWLDPAITGRVLATYRATNPPVQPSPELSRLTPQEREVLHTIGRGATNAEAADQLYVSEATIKSHLGSLLTKLGFRDRAAAIVFAHDQRLV